MQPKSNRFNDVRLENAAAGFLDEYFYSKEAVRFHTTFRRITSKEMQLKGVDVDFGGIYIDEKVKILNGMLNTVLQYPSVEISFINRANVEQCGWFVDKTKLTVYYLFISVFAYIDDPYELSTDNIDSLNLMFVKRSEIHDYLKEKNSGIIKSAMELRASDSENRVDFPHGEFHLKKSVSFAEKPINLVLRRKILLKFPSTKEIWVDRNEITRTI